MAAVTFASQHRPAAVAPASLDLAVYRRRRLVVGLVALLAILCGYFALQAAVSDIGGGPLTATDVAGGVPAAATIYVVHPGDTLWGIALAAGVHGDIRPYVDQLSAETGGTPLYPGEEIPLPPHR